MKTALETKFTLLFFIVILGCLSCQKEASPTSNGFSQDILNIVSLKTIDSLRQFGMVIHEGKTPPKLEGSYYLNQYYCSFDNSNRNKLGQKFSDYTYKFYNQNNTNLTVSVDYQTTENSDVAKGLGSFLSGDGKNFTAFLNVSSISEGIPNKSLTIISGTVDDAGIINWQNCYKLLQKDDPQQKMIAVGSTRIFYEKDLLAARN